MDKLKKRTRGSSNLKDRVFTPTEIVDWYLAFVKSKSVHAIAERMNVDRDTVDLTLSSCAALREVKAIADQHSKKENTFESYVIRRMSTTVKELWDQLLHYDKEENAYERIEEILGAKPKRLQQQIFIHAIVHSCWNPSEACRLCCIPYATFLDWKENDLEFRQLAAELDWHKKQWYKEMLDNLVKEGSERAVIFVNKTINADLGYADKLQLEHSGSVQTSAGVNIEELDLDIETRRKILDAIRRKKESERILDLPTANVRKQIEWED